MAYSWGRLKLLLRGSTELEEVCSKPDLFYMGLMTAFSYYLFDRIFFLTFFMLTQPNKRKTSTSKKANLIKTLRKAISKCLGLFSTQIEWIFLLFFPFYLNFFERFISLFPSALLISIFWSSITWWFVFLSREDFDWLDACLYLLFF
jgi:hypothetical protein